MFPYKELFLIWLVTLCYALPLQMLFPFLYFMIRDLHVAKDEKDIGFYAGFVGASFMAGRALTSVIWGMVADKHGRKQVIVITLIAIVMFNTLFGLSSKYWMAIFTRALLGLLSGMLGPIKAYATEACRKEYNHLALAIISSSRGIGLVVGPAIGGYLSQPADKYPGIFSKKSIFGRFPYFLPSLSVSILAFIALISCFWTTETLHKHTGDVADNSIETVEDSLASTDAQETRHVGGSGFLQLFKNWPLMSAIILYSIFSLEDVAYSEVFSLWAVSDRRYGGLGFSTTDVGNVLAISGLFLMLYQIFIYPSVAKLAPITLVRTTAILTVPLLSTYAILPAVLSGFPLHLVVNCASFLKNAFAVSSITVFNILINDAVTQDVRGQANGIAVTIMSIVKAIAPAVAGIIFSWAQKRQKASFLPGNIEVLLIL
ncbi:hypothetical protein HU200_010199 [Digitaria exilis]|uniref:Major facilitator superfamily (MFS) profile domain-containing protein n=1 Tax=Digitaria exilis TaxID=1010633 RepID=A0A835C5N8_9POAL|nr:hypothetical protein HU200_028494 [Digitaria exilis]KAF8760419.1 hypothetical protein HU200_010199 [Digitaria exilis]